MDDTWSTTIFTDAAGTPPGTSERQNERRLVSPSLMSYQYGSNYCNRHHHKRRREQGWLLSFLETVHLSRSDKAVRSTHTCYIPTRIALPFSLYTPGYKVSIPNSVTTYTTPSSPTLHCFPVPPLPISCQIPLGFLPPLHDLLAALSLGKYHWWWVKTFLFEHVNYVLEFRVPVLIRSFFL